MASPNRTRHRAVAQPLNVITRHMSSQPSSYSPNTAGERPSQRLNVILGSPSRDPIIRTVRRPSPLTEWQDLEALLGDMRPREWRVAH